MSSPPSVPPGVSGGAPGAANTRGPAHLLHGQRGPKRQSHLPPSGSPRVPPPPRGLSLPPGLSTPAPPLAQGRTGRERRSPPSHSVLGAVVPPGCETTESRAVSCGAPAYPQGPLCAGCSGAGRVGLPRCQAMSRSCSSRASRDTLGPNSLECRDADWP